MTGRIDTATLHIACAADGKYLPHCAAMLESLFRQRSPSTICVHFMHAPGMSVGDREMLRSWISRRGAHTNFIEIPDDAVGDLPRMDRIPQIMWYRVLLPDLLPHLDRILYLDADIIAAADPTPLWQTPLDGYWVAAVDNVLEPHFRSRPQSLGLSAENDYFNSGVLLFNLKQMRADGCTARILSLARDPRSSFLWPDQDALNVVLHHARVRLHPRWNCQNTLFFYEHGTHTFGADQVREATAQPGLVHFEGPEFTKPWHYLCTHPHQRLYWECRAQTPWPQKHLDGGTLENHLIRPLPRRLWPFAFRVTHKLRRMLA